MSPTQIKQVLPSIGVLIVRQNINQLLDIRKGSNQSQWFCRGKNDLK